jgi:hypothetical protein
MKYKKVLFAILFIAILATSFSVFYYYQTQDKNNITPVTTCIYDQRQAACNELIVTFENGYASQATKDDVRKLVKEYDGEIVNTMMDDTYWGIRLENDAKIHELKNKIDAIPHVSAYFDGINSIQ